MATVYRGHRPTLLPARVNFLFIMCIGIIRNNTFIGRRARAESMNGNESAGFMLWKSPVTNVYHRISELYLFDLRLHTIFNQTQAVTATC